MNLIFKNLYSFITIFILCIVVIIFITLSAQYIGNNLSQKILNSKVIKIWFVTNENTQNNEEIVKLSQYIDNNPNIKQSHLKIKIITEQQQNKIKTNSSSIIISKNEEFMKNLIKQEKLAILERDMFNGSTKQNTIFSKYDEYAYITTNYEDIKVYIAYTNNSKHSDKNKILSVFQILNTIVFKKDLIDPNEEDWFKPYKPKQD